METRTRKPSSFTTLEHRGNFFKKLRFRVLNFIVLLADDVNTALVY